MGPNPKFIFQVFVLLGGVLIFVAAVVLLKVRSGKCFKDVLTDHKRLFELALESAFILFIIVFLALIYINN